MCDKWNAEGVKGALWNWLLQEGFFAMVRVVHEDAIASSYFRLCLLFLTVIFSALFCSMCWPWQKYCHHQWRRKQVFCIMGNRFWDSYGSQCCQLSNLTVWTSPRRKRVQIKIMQIHVGLRLLRANVWSQEKELEFWKGILHTMGIQPGTTAGWGEVDYSPVSHKNV